LKFNLEVESLREILMSGVENDSKINGMPDFDKKLGNEEKKRQTIVLQFFDRDCESFLGDHLRNLDKIEPNKLGQLVSNLPTENIESISCHEILSLALEIQKYVEQIWCEYKNAVKITDAKIKSITQDDHYEVEVLCDHGEESWTARVKFEVLANLHEDIKKLGLRMKVPFPGKLKKMFTSRIGQITDLDVWVSDVILAIKICENEDCQTSAYALLGQTLKVPKVRPESEKINDGFDGFEGLDKFESLTDSLGSSKHKELPLSENPSKISKNTRKLSEDGSVDLEKLGDTSPRNKFLEKMNKPAESKNKSIPKGSNESSNDSSPKHEPELLEVNGPSKIIIEIVAETFKLCDNKKMDSPPNTKPTPSTRSFNKTQQTHSRSGKIIDNIIRNNYLKNSKRDKFVLAS